MIFANIDADVTVSLCFNMDGLPIFNSSAFQFWPILANVFEFPNIRPFAVAVWSGEGKPLMNGYLRDFVNKLKSILTNGVKIGNNMIRIKIKAFICDTPARAFIKGVYYLRFRMLSIVNCSVTVCDHSIALYRERERPVFSCSVWGMYSTRTSNVDTHAELVHTAYIQSGIRLPNNFKY